MNLCLLASNILVHRLFFNYIFGSLKGIEEMNENILYNIIIITYYISIHF